MLLLVEDNRDDEALILRALRKSAIPVQVVVAHDGVEALEYLKESAQNSGGHALPVFVLLDLNLPKLNGFEVLQRIRADERTRRLPVVILTSSREERDIAESYDLGASSYVRKPIGFERFAEVIREVGLYWLQINEEAPRRAG
jgi:CheY-like chemotaxis protein